MSGDMACEGSDCPDANNAVTNGLPYLILIITLVLCSILLATIALIIIVVVTRHRRKRLDSATEETAISYDDLAKPGLTAMEVQPDMRALEPRNEPRSFMPFAPLPPRRFMGPVPYDGGQRRLITVPEEEGSADEGRASTEDLIGCHAYTNYGTNGNLGDAEDDAAEEEPLHHHHHHHHPHHHHLSQHQLQQQQQQLQQQQQQQQQLQQQHGAASMAAQRAKDLDRYMTSHGHQPMGYLPDEKR